MTLYRLNLRLSQEMFTVISCFEVALRNTIDHHYKRALGPNWLMDSVKPGGRFDNLNCETTASSIRAVIEKLWPYHTHEKLVAELGFGFWRYMFSRHQYRAGGQTLLLVFSELPSSTSGRQYNSIFIFKELAKTNQIRNRIAHHEAICFIPTLYVKSTEFTRQNYFRIIHLFKWLNINGNELLHGLENVIGVCNRIDAL